MRISNHRIPCLCAMAAIAATMALQAESFDYINFSSGDNPEGMKSVRIDGGTSLRFDSGNLTLIGPDGEVGIPYDNGRLITFSTEPASVETVAAAFDGPARIVLDNGVLTVYGAEAGKGIAVYDTLGRTVASNAGAPRLSVAHLSKGVYIAAAYTPEGKVTAKIAINH